MKIWNSGWWGQTWNWTAANANIEAEKAPTDNEKVTLEIKEANNYTEEAKDSIAKFKLEAEQANAILKKHNKVTKKAKLLEFFFVWISTLPGVQNKQLETEPWNILRWVRLWALSWRVLRPKTVLWAYQLLSCSWKDCQRITNKIT